MSTSGMNAKQRIVDPAPARPYKLVGTGEVIVECAARLVGGSLVHAIDRNQKGDAVDVDLRRPSLDGNAAGRIGLAKHVLELGLDDPRRRDHRERA